MIFKHKSVNLEEVGKLKVLSSQEIKDSPISIGFECLDREMFDAERCYEPLGKTGVKWARCQTGWNRCEQQKGVYTFEWLDRIVDSLLAQGVQPWFNVGYGNKIYMKDVYSDAAVGFVPLYYGEETLQAWKNYVRALAEHFKGRVEYFEIWNESNISNFWQPRKADPEEYARFIKITADEIRSAIPNAKIGGCVATHSTWVRKGFVFKLFRTGIAKELNFFSIHAYCQQPELNYPKFVASLRRIIDENGGKHVELWQGEAGFPSWFPPVHPQLEPYVFESEHNQAIWMLRRYFTDIALGMKKSSFFQMADMMSVYKMGNATKKNPARHGILDGVNYQPKLSYKTMQHLAVFFDDKTKPAELYCAANLREALPRYERHSRLIDIAIQTYTYERNGYPFFAYSLSEDVQYGFEGIAPLMLAGEKNPALKPIEKPVLVDMLSGKIYRVKDWNVEAFDELYFFNGLPLTDYPLVICDEKALISCEFK